MDEIHDFYIIIYCTIEEVSTFLFGDRGEKKVNQLIYIQVKDSVQVHHSYRMDGAITALTTFL